LYSKILDRGTQVVAAAATLPQQEMNNSADVQRKESNFAHVRR
jgi:hypothetical protein